MVSVYCLHFSGWVFFISSEFQSDSMEKQQPKYLLNKNTCVAIMKNIKITLRSTTVWKKKLCEASSCFERQKCTLFFNIFVDDIERYKKMREVEIKLNVLRIAVRVKQNGKTHIKTYHSFSFHFFSCYACNGGACNKQPLPNGGVGKGKRKKRRNNKVNDKANVVEFHGRRLKSLGTRFENTYVIAGSYNIDTMSRSEKRQWDKCESEKHYVPGAQFRMCTRNHRQNRPRRQMHTHTYTYITFYVHKYS